MVEIIREDGQASKSHLAHFKLVQVTGLGHDPHGVTTWSLHHTDTWGFTPFPMTPIIPYSHFHRP